MQSRNCVLTGVWQRWQKISNTRIIQDASPAGVSVDAVSSSWWEGFTEIVTHIDSVFILAGAAVVLVLTTWNKFVELKIKRHHLRDLENKKMPKFPLAIHRIDSQIYRPAYVCLATQSGR